MDALRVLGSLLGNNATSGSGSIGGELLKGMLGSRGTAGRAPAASSPRMGTSVGGGLGAAEQLLQGVLGSLARSSTPRVANPSSMGMSMGGAGGSQALGGLAMAALSYFMKTSGSSPGSQGGLGALGGLMGMAPTEMPAVQPNQAMLLVQAMLNAAKADGKIDEQEKQQLVSRLQGLAPDEQAFVRQELSRPASVDFADQVPPEMAAEVYAMSLLGIRIDTEAEERYLAALAQRMGLDAQSVTAIHRQIGGMTVS